MVDLDRLSSEEKKFRKRWFKTSILLMLFLPLLYLAASINTTREFFFMICFFAATEFSRFLVFYHCSYKKHGNKFLTFTLFMVPIGTLKSLPTWIELSQNFYVKPFLITHLVILVYWYVLSLKLRKINKKWRQESKDFKLAEERALHRKMKKMMKG